MIVALSLNGSKSGGSARGPDPLTSCRSACAKCGADTGAVWYSLEEQRLPQQGDRATATRHDSLAKDRELNNFPISPGKTGGFRASYLISIPKWRGSASLIGSVGGEWVIQEGPTGAIQGLNVNVGAGLDFKIPCPIEMHSMLEVTKVIVIPSVPISPEEPEWPNPGFTP